jgi:hypothetical protein
MYIDDQENDWGRNLQDFNVQFTSQAFWANQKILALKGEVVNSEDFAGKRWASEVTQSQPLNSATATRKQPQTKHK